MNIQLSSLYISAIASKINSTNRHFQKSLLCNSKSMESNSSADRSAYDCSIVFQFTFNPLLFSSIDFHWLPLCSYPLPFSSNPLLLTSIETHSVWTFQAKGRREKFVRKECKRTKFQMERNLAKIARNASKVHFPSIWKTTTAVAWKQLSQRRNLRFQSFYKR